MDLEGTVKFEFVHPSDITGLFTMILERVLSDYFSY